MFEKLENFKTFRNLEIQKKCENVEKFWKFGKKKLEMSKKKIGNLEKNLEILKKLKL